ncbi:MAG: styrene-oxide isomerase StyC [Panacagrimonas sp.]
MPKKVLGHAFLVLFVGMCAGLGLTASLLEGFEFIPGFITKFSVPGSTDTWARAHAGGILNALMMLGVGLALPVLQFSQAATTRIGWVLIGTGWANTLFYWAALFAPNRAISFADNRWGESNLAAVIGLAPAFIAAFLMLYVALVMARQAFALRS